MSLSVRKRSPEIAVFVVPDMLPALMRPTPVTATRFSTVTSADATLVVKMKVAAAHSILDMENPPVQCFVRHRNRGGAARRHTRCTPQAPLPRGTSVLRGQRGAGRARGAP